MGDVKYKLINVAGEEQEYTQEDFDDVVDELPLYALINPGFCNAMSDKQFIKSIKWVLDSDTNNDCPHIAERLDRLINKE